MFTGLIQDVGTVESVERGADGARLRIATRLGRRDRAATRSPSTASASPRPRSTRDGFETEAMNQTLEVTALGGLEPGDRVNLELAMKASDRLGGHIVQGHVDGVGEVVSVEEDGFARRLRVELGPELLRYVVEQGLDRARRRQPHRRGARARTGSRSR